MKLFYIIYGILTIITECIKGFFEDVILDPIGFLIEEGKEKWEERHRDE